MDQTLRPPRRRKVPLAGLAMVFLLSSFAWLGAFAPGGAVAQQNREGDAVDVADLVEQVLPAVVTVYNLTTLENTMGQAEVVQQGSGTGFVISEDGYIVTNWHVVTGGQEYAVGLYDGTIVEAELIGVDARDDLAVVKIDPGDVQATVPLGDSDEIRLGQAVMAIGSPLGSFTNTVTTGVVGGLNRDTFGQMATNCQNYSNLIQHNAAINPGNSGGPLFNMDGEVIGVNTLGLPQAQDGTPLQGLFFAVPSNLVAKIVDQLVADGRISAPYIGIESQFIDAATARANNLDIPGGVYVISVVEGSPASDAGIRADDILLAIDGRQISIEDSLPRILLDYEPGDQVEITLLRGNGETTVDLEFGNVPDEVLEACEMPTRP